MFYLHSSNILENSLCSKDAHNYVCTYIKFPYKKYIAIWAKTKSETGTIECINIYI